VGITHGRALSTIEVIRSLNHPDSKSLAYDSVLRRPVFLPFFADHFPRRLGNGQAYVAIDANIYFLVEAIVDKVEAAGTDGAGGKFRLVGDTFGGGHLTSCYPTNAFRFQGKISINSAVAMV
jgi:hypothetical protein